MWIKIYIMKAKHFKKLRTTLTWYDVKVTRGLFGEFSNFNGGYITVLAKNEIQACKRAVKRGYGLEHAGRYSVTTENWGHFAVKKSAKSDHWRNITYLGN